MTASILNIGDELLAGHVVKSNAAWLGEQLSTHGFTVGRAVTVGDDLHEIRWALTGLLESAEIVICTGGLGSTPDDLTREAVSAALERPLTRREDLLEDIHRYYRGRGRDVPPTAALMADVPAGFDSIANPVGVAPGLWFAGELGSLGERAIVLLPGIPREMKMMIGETVLPRLIELQGEAVAVQKSIVTVGRGEADIVERLGDLEPWLKDGLKLSILPNYGEVRLRATVLAASRADALAQLDEFMQFAKDQLGDLVFGEGVISLPEALGEMLRASGLTLAVAESCTGGSLAAAVTDVPGSSDYFQGGAVTYSNESKVQVLGVDGDVLAKHGAVSEAVALQMAEGVRRAFGADIGISTTGVAGPGGGSPSTPVGTVWIGFADADGSTATRLQLGGDRLTIKRLSVTAALNLVRQQLLHAE